MQPSSPSMLDVLNFGEGHPDPTIGQYVKGFTAIFVKWRGFGRADLAAMPADVATYLRHAPKYSKRNRALERDLIWKPATYKQYQRMGRLLVEHFTGARAAKVARQAIADDDWAELARRATLLADAGLEARDRLARLSTITDMCRAAGLQLLDLSNAIVIALREDALTANQGAQLVRGAAFLDELRVYPDIARLLPAEPIGRIKARRRQLRVPEHLQAPLAAWIEAATTVYPEGWQSDEVREKLAERHAPGSRGVFQAALRNHVATLGRLRPIALADDLPSLFTESDIYEVTNAWDLASSEPGGLAATTQYKYMSRLAITLARNGCPDQAAIVATAIATMPMLCEGRAASERMSPKTETWCSELLADEDRLRLFETQHREYERRARAALAEAEAAGFDLAALARRPEALKRLKARRRRRAKALLRRARKFGACAAFAAIELEGAPLRKENTLGLLIAGPKATFFDHSRDKTDPHFRIVLPNELLKNGKFLTLRHQELPPIHIKDRETGDAGVRILRFYLDRIRPLFSEHDMSNALFPTVSSKERHLGAGTFGNWLLDCSIAIGFRLTSHNFRHGICSIQINDDMNCIEELAILLGDSPGTIRRYYAFLDRTRALDGVQDKIAVSRARHRSGLAPVREAA